MLLYSDFFLRFKLILNDVRGLYWAIACVIGLEMKLSARQIRVIVFMRRTAEFYW